MTARELIEALRAFPPEAEVWISHAYYGLDPARELRPATPDDANDRLEPDGRPVPPGAAVLS